MTAIHLLWRHAGAALTLLSCVALLTLPATADEPPAPIAVGQPAPGFELANQADGKVKLADFKGKRWVLVAFYPKASTPG